MKKILLLTAFAALAIVSNAQMANKNALKINPGSLLVKTGNISYERATLPNHSFQIGGFYSGAGIGDFKYQGYGITPEYRFYFGQKADLNGLYLAPFGRYQNFTITNKTVNSKATFTTVGGGATFGWQKSWEGGFVLNLFAGPSYNELKFKGEVNKEEFEIKEGIKGFGLRSGISLGFTF
jgi:hypothetical protein